MTDVLEQGVLISASAFQNLPLARGEPRTSVESADSRTGTPGESPRVEGVQQDP